MTRDSPFSFADSCTLSQKDSTSTAQADSPIAVKQAHKCKQLLSFSLFLAEQTKHRAKAREKKASLPRA